METTNGRESFHVHSSGANGDQIDTRPGILVFSDTLQLLYVNRRAAVLMGQPETVTPALFRLVLPLPVIELRTEVRTALESYLAAGAKEPFEVRKAVSVHGAAVLLRGFGVPDRSAGARPRIVILLEELPAPQESSLVCKHVAAAHLSKAVA